jgi:hypothetical protein
MFNILKIQSYQPLPEDNAASSVEMRKKVNNGMLGGN